jgi:mono/diheme cytochrome c family protein
LNSTLAKEGPLPTIEAACETFHKLPLTPPTARPVSLGESLPLQEVASQRDPGSLPGQGARIGLLAGFCSPLAAMKYFFLTCFFLAALIVAGAGFRGSKTELPPIEIFDDMDHQAKVKYQRESQFFSDGVASRKPVSGSVPMGFEVPSKPASEGAAPSVFGFANGVDYFNTGKVGDYYGDGFPAELVLDQTFIERGQQRYRIYCAVCHGESGNGKGTTSKFGILTAFSFQQAGNLDATNATAYRPAGAIYDTITNGKGLMGPYGGAIPVRDRWAIVAYIRALQLAAKDAGGIQ